MIDASTATHLSKPFKVKTKDLAPTTLTLTVPYTLRLLSTAPPLALGNIGTDPIGCKVGS
jgi:hypothetical protein